jgi:hypothetical protein
MFGSRRDPHPIAPRKASTRVRVTGTRAAMPRDTSEWLVQRASAANCVVGRESRIMAMECEMTGARMQYAVAPPHTRAPAEGSW